MTATSAGTILHAAEIDWSIASHAKGESVVRRSGLPGVEVAAVAGESAVVVAASADARDSGHRKKRAIVNREVLHEIFRRVPMHLVYCAARG